MGERPNGLWLFRIDNEKDFCPDNCKWATPKDILRNTKRNKLYYFKGKNRTLMEISEIVNISDRCLWRRIKQLGWDPEKAFNTPVAQKKLSK